MSRDARPTRPRIWRPAAVLILVSAAIWAFVLFGPPYLAMLWGRVPDFVYPWISKSIHVLAFVGWTVAFIRLARAVTNKPWSWPHVVVPIAAALISEPIQIFTPAHVPDWVGLGMSLLGVGFGLILLALRNDEPPSPNRTDVTVRADRSLEFARDR